MVTRLNGTKEYSRELKNKHRILKRVSIKTIKQKMVMMKAVCGRLKSDYSYSKDIVYNNFVWCDVTETQKSAIEKLAQGVLDARALFPDSSLADLYDPLIMPS